MRAEQIATVEEGRGARWCEYLGECVSVEKFVRAEASSVSDIATVLRPATSTIGSQFEEDGYVRAAPKGKRSGS